MPTPECASCHAEICWAEKTPPELNDRGLPKMIPVDSSSVGAPAGGIEVWREDVIPVAGGGYAPVMRGRYLRQGDVVPDGHQRAVTHFASCPYSGQWRRTGRAG
jgi:hypothetical protein